MTDAERGEAPVVAPTITDVVPQVIEPAKVKLESKEKPYTRTSKNLSREAQLFLDTKSVYSCRAPSFTPTLEEIQSKSFQDYVQSVLLDPSGAWPHGIAKITLPSNPQHEGISNDTTARGPQWQEGTRLGDFMVENPIKQCVSGIGGVYEYTLLDQKSLPVWQFREKADAYRMKQLGQALNDKWTDEVCDELATKFWKRMGPYMESSMYGADMEGSLFPKDYGDWNLQSLESCLQLLSSNGSLPGVTTPYLYFGMWASVFCVHTEDMNLLSINYLHAGAPKYWYAIAPDHAQRFENLANFKFAHAAQGCREFLRHKRHLLSPTLLKKAGVPFQVQIQRPGDAVITYPGAYHFGINLGFNVAEATNFAIPEWIPKGLEAKVCMCRPHSVRIDVEHFQSLLEQYEEDMQNAATLGFPKLSYRQWTMVQSNRKELNQQTQKDDAPVFIAPNGKKYLSTEEVLDDQIKAKMRKEFVVEVTRPVTSSTTTTKKSRKKRKKLEPEEDWRLAQPAAPKKFVVNAKVLVLLPGKEVNASADSEQCFAGEITEVADDCVRVHFGGLSREEDVWIPADSNKIFLDGGRQYYD